MTDLTTAAEHVAGQVDDRSTWLPLDGLAPGFDANKAPVSAALVGRQFAVSLANGARKTYEFASASQASRDGAASGYEAFEVASGLFFVEFTPESGARETISLVLDVANGRAFEVVTTIGEASVHALAAEQDFRAGVIDGAEVRGHAPAATHDLIGRRVMWIYSEAHAYEHVYLSEHWYTWQCLAGPERGLADTDACTYYRVRPGIYVFAWREKVIPCAAVTVADHGALRSHGMLFGLDETGEQSTHFTYGAYGRLLGQTVHPDRYDPRAIAFEL